MPPVRSVNFDDGIAIFLTGGAQFIESKLNIQGRLAGVSGNLKKKEAKFNKWLQLQSPFANVIPLIDLEPDDRVLQAPPILLPYEYLDGDNYVGIKMYVAVHIYEASPLRFNIIIQNKQLGPISGEWW